MEKFGAAELDLSDEAVFQNRISTSIIVQIYLKDLHHIACRDMSYWILQISHHQDSGILQPHRYGPTSLNLISTLSLNLSLPFYDPLQGPGKQSGPHCHMELHAYGDAVTFQLSLRLRIDPKTMFLVLCILPHELIDIRRALILCPLSLTRVPLTLSSAPKLKKTDASRRFGQTLPGRDARELMTSMQLDGSTAF
jgi:hypothetical protein